MIIKFNPFPTAYFNVICTKHECYVEIRIEESKKFNMEQIIGGRVAPLRCREGGAPDEADCTSNWEISILGGGDITIAE